MSEPSPPLLEVENLAIGFRQGKGPLATVVEDVSFSIGRGESLAVVGESGSGKSVTALSLTRLLPEPPAEITRGAIRFEGEDVLKMKGAALRKLRGGGIGYVFQEASSSLNPVFRIGQQIVETLRLHRPELDKADREDEAVQWLDRVGIVKPAERFRSYPHELSGGMQQRVMIAMALCAQPQLLVADEPTTALDVTVQAKILELLAELREETGMALLFVTHNLGIVERVADRIAVFLRGHLVEEGTTKSILRDPEHAYTQALLGCVPRLGAKRNRLPTIPRDLLDS